VALLTTAEYPAIRAAIDVSLDSAALPDATIALGIYAGAAELDVISRDPLALSRTGAELAHVTNAAIYFCAARLIVALPQILRETFADHSYERGQTDIAQRAGELRALATAEIETVISPTDTTPAMPTMFTVGTGDRGR
jgi:hypothetical protein